MEIKKVCVGSKNPSKVESVSRVIKKLYPDALVLGIDSPSGVSSQPLCDEEGIMGATNRAKYAIEQGCGDLGVGIEGIVEDNSSGTFLRTWIVTIDRLENSGIGDGGSLLLPSKVAQKVKNGVELGKVMDILIGCSETSKGPGAYGIFTNNMVTRSDALERGVIFSLAPFINPKYYR